MALANEFLFFKRKFESTFPYPPASGAELMLVDLSYDKIKKN